MTRLPHASVDLRGFPWQLLPLERKLSWERDACRGRLAQALGAARDAERRLAEADAIRQEEVRCAAAAMQDILDPQAHRHLLHHLARLQQQRRTAARRAAMQEDELARARAACIASERRVETLASVRAAAMRTYVRAAVLRADREADADWIAHVPSHRVAPEVAP